MNKIILIFSAVLLLSCKGDHIDETKVGDFELELLFEHEGCKMYRFLDGHWIYWSDCSGRIEYNTGGKNNIDMQNVTTK